MNRALLSRRTRPTRRGATVAVEVLVCGSPDRGDDGAPLAVMRRLRDQLPTDVTMRAVGMLDVDDLLSVPAGAGVVIVDADGEQSVPAFQVDVVDTTGCGDAFSAGFLRGLSLARDRREAAVLGCATAAQVAQGLGTDHGDYDLATVERLALDTQ